MRVAFNPAPGQVALIEHVSLRSGPADTDRIPMTGVVQSSTDDDLTIMGLSPHDLGEEGGEADGIEVIVSIFSPEALYRIHGHASRVDSERLRIDPIGDVERIERRSWPRHPVHVNITLASLDQQDDDVGGVAGRTIDLGVGGLRVETIRRLAPGADPTVMFTLPDGSAVVARTTVVSAHVDDQGCEYGLTFTDLDDADAAHLMALVGAQSAGAR